MSSCARYLKELVESAESTGSHDKRLAVVQHPKLSCEKVVELEGQLGRDVLVQS